MTWLLTGGAGYIGSHVLRCMRDAGHQIVVLDDLSTGLRFRVPDDVPMVVASVLDRDALDALFQAHQIEGVIHLAAKKSVPDSVAEPLHYYRENVIGMITLLEAMIAAGVTKLVHSSSAAVYGQPDSDAVTEDAPTLPESPYGRTKLMAEWMIRDLTLATDFASINLRYFNVVGTAAPELADTIGQNLFPLVMRALLRGDAPVVFGEDYPTRDGSCIRDYIHVHDLALAHVSAVDWLAEGRGDQIVNIGCGTGHTVKEVLTTVAKITGRDTTPTMLARRPGDPGAMVAVADKAHDMLAWKSQYNLDQMVSSSWEAMVEANAQGQVVPSDPVREVSP